MELEINNDDMIHIQNAFRDIPFYSKYYQEIKDKTHTSETLLYSGMQYMLSLGLQNASISSEMGSVRPNIGVVGILPSGYSKSPMLNAIRDVLRFWDYGRNNYIQKFETFSPEGVKSFLNKLSEEEKSQLYKMTILRDEVSTLAKSTKNGMMSVSGLEFLSQLIDGRVEQHDTRTSEHETFPDPIYCSMWLTGTAGFWTHITNDWWMQGIAFRMLHPLIGDMDTRGIKLEYSNNSLEELKPFIDSLTRITEFIADDTFKELYEQRTNEIKEIQKRAILEGKSEDMEIQYYKKFPEIILKLAMIHKASMMEEPKKISADNEKRDRYALFLTKEDFDWAEKDFEMYRKGFLQAYNAYLDAQSEKYKRIDMSSMENQFMRYYHILKEKKKLTYTINDDNTITKDEKGEWIKLSDITTSANFSPRDRKNVTESLLSKDLIEKQIGVNHFKAVEMVRLIQ